MAPKKRRSDKDDEPTLGNPDADPQRIHREYVEQHFGGGEEPTPEAYERALDEWHRLPGAAHRPPGEIRGPEEEQALQERRAPESADQDAPPASEDEGPDEPEDGAS